MKFEFFNEYFNILKIASKLLHVGILIKIVTALMKKKNYIFMSMFN